MQSGDSRFSLSRRAAKVLDRGAIQGNAMNQTDLLKIDVLPHRDGVYLIRDGHRVDIPYAEIPALMERLERSLPEICRQCARSIKHGG